MNYKYARVWLLATIVPAVLGSCGSDDPPPKTGIAFEKSTEEITESDGTPASFHPDASAQLGLSGGQGRNITVKLTLDRPLADEAVLSYTVTGSTNPDNPTGREVNDYTIAETGDGLTIKNGKITVAKGATEASITITVFEDTIFEYDKDVLNDNQVSYETLILTLTGVVSGPAELGTETAYTMKIAEDDAVFLLNWAVDGGNMPGDVDMDMLFLHDDEIIWGSALTNSAYEIVNFPAGFPSGTYGAGYTYYSGTSDDVDFQVSILSTSGKLGGKSYPYPDADPLAFGGHLGLGNINTWDDPGLAGYRGQPVVVQTFTKEGLNYTGISSITALAADASSRQARRYDIKDVIAGGQTQNRFRLLKEQ